MQAFGQLYNQYRYPFQGLSLIKAKTKKTILIPICIRRKGKCFSGFAQTTKMFFLVFPVCAASL